MVRKTHFLLWGPACLTSSISCDPCLSRVRLCGVRGYLGFDLVREVVSEERLSNGVGHKRARERETVAQVLRQQTFLSFRRKERPLLKTQVTDRIGLQQVRLSWKRRRKEVSGEGGQRVIEDEVTAVHPIAAHGDEKLTMILRNFSHNLRLMIALKSSEAKSRLPTWELTQC